MKRVLFIIDHLKGGGAERITLELAQQLHLLGFHIQIALLDSSNIRMPIPEGIEQINLNLSSTFLQGKLWRKRDHLFTLEDQAKIKNLVQNSQADAIILSHWYAFFVSPAIQHHNVWFWVHCDIHNPFRKKTSNLFRYLKELRRWKLDNKYFNLLLEHKNIITVNEDLKQAYQPVIPHARIESIANGVNSTRLLQGLDLTSSINKIYDCIFVGRLSQEKQPAHAIRAFAQSGLTGKMAIVGDGELIPELITLSKELNIQQRIDFLGWQDNPAQFIQQAKTLVVSSSHEGSCLVIAEALHLDVPVVAYNINHGILHQLDHENLRQGIVENQNIEQLATTLYQVAQNPYSISSEDKYRLSIERMTTEFIETLALSV